MHFLIIRFNDQVAMNGCNGQVFFYTNYTILVCVVPIPDLHTILPNLIISEGLNLL